MSPRLVWSDFLATMVGALPDKVEWMEEKDRFFHPGEPRREIKTRELTEAECAIVAYLSKEIRALEKRVKILEAVRR